MDRELKARKLASASVRKQRMQERQQQKDLLHEQREERRKRFQRYSEIYSTNSNTPDSSRSNTPENDSSAETPSEYNVQTPHQSFSPDVEIENHATDLAKTAMQIREEDLNAQKKSSLLERRRSKTTSLKLTMQASLLRPCDFRYDRFSTIIEPIEVPQQSEDDLSSSEEQSDDDYSPIEVATPVAIRMPISRPSVISVVEKNKDPGPQRFSIKNINTIMTNPPRPPASRLRTTESISEPGPQTESGFLASEAKPLEVPTPTRSVTNIEPSSATLSTKSLPASAQTTINNSLKEKSSMPMLTKFTHARMSSIKIFMKPGSISEPPPAVPIVPAAHQNRPSESVNVVLTPANSSHQRLSSVAKGLPTSPRRSVTEPNLKIIPQAQRPQTARTTSQSTITQVVSRSSIVSTTPSSATIQEDKEEPAMARKKSFPNLRRRSGSLGQALFGSNKTKLPALEEPLPPMPTIRLPSRDSMQSTKFPTPPPKTPRSTRKSGLMMYSPFPPAQKGEPVGLGLRM